MADEPTCRMCGGAVKGNTCTQCGMFISEKGLKVEGTNALHVFAVAAGLIVLIFILAVIWRMLPS